MGTRDVSLTSTVWKTVDVRVSRRASDDGRVVWLDMRDDSMVAVLEVMETSLVADAMVVEDAVDKDVNPEVVPNDDDDNIDVELERGRFCKPNTVTPNVAKMRITKFIVESCFRQM